MAQQVTTTFTDDLDGGPAQGTVRFGLDGTDFEVDLSEVNAKTLRAHLAPFVDVARKVKHGQPVKAAVSTTSRDESRAARAWAQQHGIPVRDRGRVHGRIVDAYRAGDPSLAAGVVAAMPTTSV